jgi:hypothetical protein
MTEFRGEAQLTMPGYLEDQAAPHEFFIQLPEHHA